MLKSRKTDGRKPGLGSAKEKPPYRKNHLGETVKLLDRPTTTAIGGLRNFKLTSCAGAGLLIFILIVEVFKLRLNALMS